MTDKESISKILTERDVNLDQNSGFGYSVTFLTDMTIRVDDMLGNSKIYSLTDGKEYVPIQDTLTETAAETPTETTVTTVATDTKDNENKPTKETKMNQHTGNHTNKLSYEDHDAITQSLIRLGTPAPQAVGLHTTADLTKCIAYDPQYNKSTGRVLIFIRESQSGKLYVRQIMSPAFSAGLQFGAKVNTDDSGSILKISDSTGSTWTYTLTSDNTYEQSSTSTKIGNMKMNDTQTQIALNNHVMLLSAVLSEVQSIVYTRRDFDENNQKELLGKVETVFKEISKIIKDNPRIPNPGVQEMVKQQQEQMSQWQQSQFPQGRQPYSNMNNQPRHFDPAVPSGFATFGQPFACGVGPQVYEQTRSAMPGPIHGSGQYSSQPTHQSSNHPGTGQFSNQPVQQPGTNFLLASSQERMKRLEEQVAYLLNKQQF